MHLHLDVLLSVILADNIEGRDWSGAIGAIVGSVGREEVQKGERKGSRKIEAEGRSEKGKVEKEEKERIEKARIPKNDKLLL